MNIKLKGKPRENTSLYYDSLKMVLRPVTPTERKEEMESQVQEPSLNDLSYSDSKFQSAFKETIKIMLPSMTAIIDLT